MKVKEFIEMLKMLENQEAEIEIEDWECNYDDIPITNIFIKHGKYIISTGP